MRRRRSISARRRRARYFYAESVQLNGTPDSDGNAAPMPREPPVTREQRWSLRGSYQILESQSTPLAWGSGW
jgi:hypothetical protein